METQTLTDDYQIISQIFEDKIYDSLYLLKSEIKKISDYKLQVGLITELLVRSNLYNLSIDDMQDIIDDIKQPDTDIYAYHDYYVDFLIGDCRSDLWDFFQQEGDLSENEEFISWIKSLSNTNTEKVKELCLEMEIYELIPFIDDLRK